ncbi:MAG TPA: hypothetical protein VI455_17890 [Terriglobia bacterium]
MSIPSITDPSATPTFQKDSQAQALSEFQQLTADLRSGNLSQAQADYANLAKNAPAAAQNSSTPLGKAFSQLGQALQSGNLSAAQQALAAVTHQLGRHHHGVRPSESASSSSVLETGPAASTNTSGSGLNLTA